MARKLPWKKQSAGATPYRAVSSASRPATPASSKSVMRDESVPRKPSSERGPGADLGAQVKSSESKSSLSHSNSYAYARTVH
jgi:hypothetical protein